MEEHKQNAETGDKSEAKRQGGGGIGQILSLIIVMIVIIVGALYAWGERIQKNNYEGGANLPQTPSPSFE